MIPVEIGPGRLILRLERGRANWPVSYSQRAEGEGGVTQSSVETEGESVGNSRPDSSQGVILRGAPDAGPKRGGVIVKRKRSVFGLEAA